MKNLDFNIMAGWPASTETWKWIQEMINTAAETAKLAGNNCFISGAVESGGNVTAGIAVVNGELVPFAGGPVGEKIIVTDAVSNRNFFGGASNPYYHDRVAVFGDGPDAVLYSDFRRSDPANGVLSRLDKIEKMLKPLMGYDVAGTTVYGSWLFWGRPAGEIPAGWEPVPDVDWKGKFPVVMDPADPDFDTVGESAGSKTHLLTAAEQGKLKWSVRANDGDSDVANYKSISAIKIGANTVAAGNPGAGTNFSAEQWSADQLSSLENATTAFKHIPPYKVVMFIRFVG